MHHAHVVFGMGSVNLKHGEAHDQGPRLPSAESPPSAVFSNMS